MISAAGHITLTEKLSLPPETSLQIQRAHRALTQKPSRGAPPRSMIVNFLQFSTKESVLKAAWQKKIEVEGRRLIFDPDYPVDVVQKRKAYSGVKKALKEKGVRFQTPFTKMRIHWDSGVKVYESAWEAAEELRRRGFTVELPTQDNTEDDVIQERLLHGFPWQRPGEKSGNGAARRAKEKLQEFGRATS